MARSGHFETLTPERETWTVYALADVIIAVAGTLYAVLLGFLTAVAWQDFAEARQLVALESAAATDVWHTAVGMPEQQRVRVRRDTLDYATYVSRIEWPQMRAGRFDAQAD